MSGHSKWHNIQQKKGKADKARSNAFTKVSHAITLAARQGGGDPESNFTLRLAIDKAKEVNMPKDNIDRAIKRGTGELDDGSQIEEVLYEGFGPGGVAFIVETMTDNKNRTVSEIKNIFSKHGGSLGGPNSVRWQFERKGVVRFSKEKKSAVADFDNFSLGLLDIGAEDVRENEDFFEIISPVDKFAAVVGAVKAAGIEPDTNDLEWLAKEKIDTDESTSNKVMSLYDALDENDDVNNVYTNEA